MSDLDALKSWVHDASLRPDVGIAVASVYEELAAETERRRPICIVSGRCCRFEEYGHRLFVTTMELAAFVNQYSAAGHGKEWNGKGCPFQIGKLCGVHAFRPMGCRIFFCDASAAQWQQDLYERLHGRLKQLHKELKVPYAYVEWRQALMALGLAEIGNLSGVTDINVESF